MPHLFSRLHKHKSPTDTTLSTTKSAPSTTSTTSKPITTTTNTTTTPNAPHNPLQPLSKNRTVGPEVSAMRTWDWTETRRKDSGTGAAFLEDVRMGGAGMASPKSSVAMGATDMEGLESVAKKSSLGSGGGTL